MSSANLGAMFEHPVYGDNRSDYTDSSPGWSVDGKCRIEDSEECVFSVEADIQEPLLKELYENNLAFIAARLSAPVTHATQSAAITSGSKGEVSLPVSDFSSDERRAVGSAEIQAMDFRLYLREGATSTEASLDNANWFACGVDPIFVPDCGYVDVEAGAPLAEPAEFSIPTIEKESAGYTSILAFRKTDVPGRSYFDLDRSDCVIRYIDDEQFEHYNEMNNKNRESCRTYIVASQLRALFYEIEENVEECTALPWYERLNELLEKKGRPPFEKQQREEWETSIFALVEKDHMIEIVS